jgi:hypothetical protein
MQAVAFQVIHLVDVDRSREDGPHQAQPRRIGPGDEHVEHFRGFDLPFALQDLAEFARWRKELGGECFVRRQVRQHHIFDGMTKRPVAEVVEQRGDHQNFGLMRVDG